MKREVRLKSGAVPATVVPIHKGLVNTFATVSTFGMGRRPNRGKPGDLPQSITLLFAFGNKSKGFYGKTVRSLSIRFFSPWGSEKL